MAGDLSTTMFHLPIHVGVAAFALCTVTIYLAAGGLAAFQHPLASPLLVGMFSCGTCNTTERYIAQHNATHHSTIQH